MRGALSWRRTGAAISAPFRRPRLSSPTNLRSRTTIFIRNGRYEEIVFFSGKSNITIRGENREKVEVGYPNNSAFNPRASGPSRRPAFTI